MILSDNYKKIISMCSANKNVWLYLTIIKEIKKTEMVPDLVNLIKQDIPMECKKFIKKILCDLTEEDYGDINVYLQWFENEKKLTKIDKQSIKRKMEQARDLCKDGRYDESIIILEEVISRDAFNNSALENLVVLYNEKKEYGKAIDLCMKLNRITQNSPFYYTDPERDIVSKNMMKEYKLRHFLYNKINMEESAITYYMGRVKILVEYNRHEDARKGLDYLLNHAKNIKASESLMKIIEEEIESIKAVDQS